jgi:hypothetical protein
MAEEDLSLSKDSTIYNYTLLKRIHHSLYKAIMYAAFILILAAYDFSNQSWLELIIAYPITLVAHLGIVRCYFYFTNGRVMHGWTFRWNLFWTGILPNGYASIRLVGKVQRHLFWIGFVLLLGLYPWLSNRLLLNLAYTHGWLCLPRLWMLLRFRSYRKKGLIKFTHKETSCYLP